MVAHSVQSDRKTMTRTSPDPANLEWLGGLIQTTDTLFPSGGYAHSYGLEELVALGRIGSINDLEEFLIDEILPALEKQELPYLRFCSEAVRDGEYEDLMKLNEEISSWKLTREIRDAGSSQGSQMIRMIREIYECPVSADFHRRLQESGEPCQQITATALLRNAQGIPLNSSMIAWIYQAISNFCSASVKLLRLGEVACQRIIHHCLEPDRLQKVLAKSLRVKREWAGFFNPALDLASARHELAFSRLFIS